MEGHLHPEFQKNIIKPGDPAHPGAGRPKGSKTRLPALPPIHVDKLPFPIVKLKQRETAHDYWNRQAPKTLLYLVKRFNAFLMYQEQGINDPLGAQIFKLLGKELVKDIRTKAEKKRENSTTSRPGEGKTIKEYRKSLVKMRESLVDDAEIIDEELPSDGEYTPVEEVTDLLGGIEDEFEN